MDQNYHKLVGKKVVVKLRAETITGTIRETAKGAFILDDVRLAEGDCKSVTDPSVLPKGPMITDMDNLGE